MWDQVSSSHLPLHTFSTAILQRVVMSDGGAELNPTVDFIAGTISGIAGLVVGYPFDTVKVRFQDPSTRGKYTSTMDALTKIVREERFIGLYKGIVSPLATTALMNGLVFASYRFLLKLQSSDSALPPTLTQITLAGAGSGIISSIITTPTELIKIRQQQQVGLVQRSTLSAALEVIRTGGFGLKGLYRGMPVTALRDIGYGGYFWAYEATCRAFAPSTPNILDASVHPDEIHLLLRDLDGSGSSTPSWAVMLLAGGLAGIAGWLTTFPLDVIKTRMQGAAMGLPMGDHAPLLPGAVHSIPHPYRTIWSTVTHSYKAEGAGVFFRGLAPTLIRAVPVNMATFATFEAIVRVLS